MFTSIIRSHSSTLSAAIGAMGNDPGIVHDRGRFGPYLSTVPLTKASTSPRFVTSVFETEGAASLGVNVPDEGVDPIFAPRSERDFRAIPCEKASRAFANTRCWPP